MQWIAIRRLRVRLTRVGQELCDRLRDDWCLGHTLLAAELLFESVLDRRRAAAGGGEDGAKRIRGAVRGLRHGGRPRIADNLVAKVRLLLG